MGTSQYASNEAEETGHLITGHQLTEWRGFYDKVGRSLSDKASVQAVAFQLAYPSFP